jgi:hypothetical protein
MSKITITKEELKDYEEKADALAYVYWFCTDEISNTELSEEICESIGDGITYGRKELAEILLQKLEEKPNEQL